LYQHASLFRIIDRIPVRHPPDTAAPRDLETLLMFASKKDRGEKLRTSDLVTNVHEVARVVLWAKARGIFLYLS
jgi:hypothetical protein